MPVEVAWLPKFGDGTLTGSYKVGGWYDTSTADDAVSDINGDPFVLTGLPPLQRKGRYGGYINFQQGLTSNLSVFLNVVMADKRTSTVDRQIAAGLIYTGPLSWRPNDDIGFAAGTTHVNSRVADAEKLQNAAGDSVAVQGSEYAFELYYTFVREPDCSSVRMSSMCGTPAAPARTMMCVRSARRPRPTSDCAVPLRTLPKFHSPEMAL